MFYHNIDPVFLNLGFIQIRWYGLIYVIGIFLSYFLFRYLAKKKKLKLSEKDFEDALMYGVIGLVIGARLGSVISNLPFYLANPLEIFAVWNGGMAFHGGLLGVIVAGLIFSRERKISFYQIADMIVIPVTLALALGRIANFINGEFYGTITSLPWGVKFPDAEGFRHPVQIYESVKNLFIFSVLWLVKNKDMPSGTLFWIFIAMYGGLRFTIEFYKDLPALLFGLTWGQLWCLPMFVIGAFMLHQLGRKNLESKN